jgi:putative aminopeptidase FrvX
MEQQAQREEKLQQLLQDPALPSQTKQIVSYLITEIEELRSRVRWLETSKITNLIPSGGQGW